ncbi:Cerevisin [Dactylellina cionopaga]|nr:Cerevisin [Dactylellina cionopaga]
MGYNVSSTGLGARSDDPAQNFQTHTGSSIQTFGSNIRGFTMKMRRSEGTSISSLPNIATVEKNIVAFSYVMPDPVQVPPQRPKAYKRAYYNVQAGGPATQDTAPWNLQRISSLAKVTFETKGVTDMSFTFRYPTQPGAGVDVYVLDTGLNPSHSDFEARAKMIFSAIGDSGEDQAGHGTHVAGTVASKTYGIAKNANINAIKILGANGRSTADIFIKGIDYALTQHKSRMTQPNFKGSVINLSGGIDRHSEALRKILTDATNAGMHVAVAAGNDNQDACNAFPAAYTKDIPIISVGATDQDDKRAYFSNFGSCVDVLAPGVAVTSTSNTGATMQKQGTSMACPHVAGVIATELINRPDLKLKPLEMKKFILSRGIAKVRTPPRGQLLLNNGFQ